MLNPNAWTDPPAGQWGTSAAYYNDYRFQRRPNESMSLGREFQIRERIKFNIRAEFTNIFNRTEPNNPAATNAKAASAQNPTTGQYTAGFGWENAASVFANQRQGTIIGRLIF